MVFARMSPAGPVAQWTEQGTPKPLVGGSIPSGPATSHPARGFALSPSPKPDKKAPAHPLQKAVEAFLLTKRVAGCAETTLQSYAWWLERLLSDIREAAPLAVQEFFARLQERGLSASRRHQAYRTLKTFFRWAVEVGALPENPLRGFVMHTPKTLPDVPTEDEVRIILSVCPHTLEGIRNRALILALADSGLRANEVLRLLTEDWRPVDRGLFVRAGKGGKDRVAFVGPTTTRALKVWLAIHPGLSTEAFLFIDRRGRPLRYRHLVQILHRLSQKAGLPNHRRLHPHALRHFAATSWLRAGVGLDEVRRLLGHESLNTTLRYSNLVGTDLQRAHRKAGAIERMRLD